MLFQMLLGIFSHFPVFHLRVDHAGTYPPPLSQEEETELFIKKEAGDATAREKLILHNMRLVAHIVKKHYAASKNQDDLISIGTIGLIKAIDTYRISGGARFATYASRCLQNEILMYFRSQKKSSMEVSINEAIDTDKDGNPLTYIDIISVDDTIADDIDKKICSRRAAEYIRDRLSPRERSILVLRYGLDGSSPITQREAAKRLSISRSYVSRIEKAALAKVSAYLSQSAGAAHDTFYVK